MATIQNQEDFIRWINQPSISKSKDYYENNSYEIEGNILTITDLIFKDLNLENKNIESTDFVNCVFYNCTFHHTIISYCLFKKCNFQYCTIEWSKFLVTEIVNSQFESCFVSGFELIDINAQKAVFTNCAEIYDLKIKTGLKIKREFKFHNCYLAGLDLEYDGEIIGAKPQDRFYFSDCLINRSNFNGINLSESNFENCNLSVNQFSNCLLSEKTLIKKNETPSNEFNFIDIRTLINSPTQGSNVLEAIFGIHSIDIKDYLIGLTSKIQFQSIFISYSFSDKYIAHLINENLIKRGILTFLWEKDAPGGKQIKEIMSSGVMEKDRVLFIASKNSLKSTACHFELSEGRKKQEQIWEDVLFPIHIDQYLFEVRKDKIRPIEVQDEYWQNIEELRRLNSIDFSDCFNEKHLVTPAFEKKIFELIKGLRKQS